LVRAVLWVEHTRVGAQIVWSLTLHEVKN